MTRRRSPLIVLLFAVLLAFGQQQALSHALSHASAHALDQEQARAHGDTKSTGHPDDVCAKCLVFAHLDHASDVAALAFGDAAQAPAVDRAVRRRDPAVASIVRYETRAPPHFS